MSTFLEHGVVVSRWSCCVRLHGCRVLRSEERKCVVRFGGLVIHNIGQLLPVQIHSGCFNTSEYVYPVSCRFFSYHTSLSVTSVLRLRISATLQGVWQMYPGIHPGPLSLVFIQAHSAHSVHTLSTGDEFDYCWGRKFELRCGQKSVFSRKSLQYAALGTGCTLTAVPRSAQPSTLWGTVNEYQPYKWLSNNTNGDGQMFGL